MFFLHGFSQYIWKFKFCYYLPVQLLDVDYSKDFGDIVLFWVIFGGFSYHVLYDVSCH